MLSYEKHYTQYKGIIYKLIRQYSTHFNFSDMAQSAHLGYAEALKSYKKDSGASLGTWIFIQVRKQCQTQRNLEYTTKAHSETRKKLEPEERTQVYDYTSIDNQTPYDKMILNDRPAEINLIVSLMSKKITKLERSIFIDYYLKNYTITRLKNKYHIANFDNLFEKFKANLKEIKKMLYD